MMYPVQETLEHTETVSLQAKEMGLHSSPVEPASHQKARTGEAAPAALRGHRVGTMICRFLSLPLVLQTGLLCQRALEESFQN